MKRHALILGSMMVCSGLLLGEAVSPNSGSRNTSWLQPVSASQQPQEAGNEPSNREVTHQNKKARKQQEKAEKQRRKREARERQKQLKKEQQQEAAERTREMKQENKEIAKQRRQQQREEQKEAKKDGNRRVGQERREEARNAPVPPPQDRDRDRQNVNQAQNTPPPPMTNNEERDRTARDRDDQNRRDQDRDRDRMARDRDDQNRRDRDRDRDRDHQNVAGSPPPTTTPPPNTTPPPTVAGNQNGNQIAQDRDDQDRRDRDDRFRRDHDTDRDRDRDRMAQDRDDQFRRDHDRDRDRDQDRDRERIARDRDDQFRRDHDVDRDRDRDRELAENRDHDRERFGPNRIRRPDFRDLDLASNPAPGALQAQRNVSHAIYSQLPNSNVMVLLNNANQIVLRGSAPTPGLRSRLLQLAGGAAGGYSIVDQLASDAVSSAAGSVASGMVGGVGSLFHHSGSSDSGYDNGNYNPPYSSGAVASNGYGQSAASGNSGAYYASNPSFGGFQPGTNGCLNTYNNNQVVITGQAASQADADALRQIAQQLGGSNANVVNQLTVNGTSASTSTAASGSTGSTTSGIPNSAASSSSVVSPGSVVCLNADNNNQVLLTGNLGSPAELGSVERSLQPVLGNERLVDQINTPGGNRVASNAAGTIASNSRSLNSTPATSPTEAQIKVQEAVHSLPSLANVDAEVTGNTVRLTGSVPSRDDQENARDIAEQYAPGRNVLDNLTVQNRGAQNTQDQSTTR